MDAQWYYQISKKIQLMTPQNILVSVLMTSYNRASFVANAIESVLASTYTNFEFIICDDCSTDGTYEIEKEYAKQFNSGIFFM